MRSNIEIIQDIDRIHKEHISLLRDRIEFLEKTILIKEETIKTLKLLVETLSIKEK